MTKKSVYCPTLLHGILSKTSPANTKHTFLTFCLPLDTKIQIKAHGSELQGQEETGRSYVTNE